MADPKIKVPTNLVPVVDAVSLVTGVPFTVIAAVIQSQSGWPNSLTPNVIGEVGRVLSTAKAAQTTPSGLYSGVADDWVSLATMVFGNGSAKWRERFVDIYDPEQPDDNARWDHANTNPEPSGTFTTPVLLRNPLYGNIGGTRVTIRTGNEVSPLTGPNAIVDPETAYQMFERFTGRTPQPDEANRYLGMTVSQAEAALNAHPEAADWRQYGTGVQRNRSWINTIYERTLNRAPRPEELIEVIQRGYGQKDLERVLRSQPYGGGTIGQARDTEGIADQYAKQFLGREADAGEVNFLVQNGITEPDHVAAYYEQLRQRVETGDPAFVWAGNPQSWRGMRDTIEQVWKKAGLTGEINPNLVNQAVSGKWSEDQIAAYVDDLDAPGFQAGVKVGQVNRIRPIAERWKQTWYPAQGASQEELKHFIGSQMTSEQIRDYYGGLPKNLSTGGQDLGNITNPEHLDRPSRQNGSVTA